MNKVGNPAVAKVYKLNPGSLGCLLHQRILWAGLLLLALLTACGGGGGDFKEPAGDSLHPLAALLAGQGEPRCVDISRARFPHHRQWLCDDDSGYRFHVDLPRDGHVTTVAVILHAAGSDGRETQALLAANAPAEDLANTLLIYPVARSYGVVTGVVGLRLWNGSGQRQAGDNGCCVDNGLADRSFINSLLDVLAESLPTPPRYLVGISNGGMLALDLALNESLPVSGYLIVAGSNQTTTRLNQRVAGDLVLIASKDDEVIPYGGGVIDLGYYAPFLAQVNAENQQVLAPSFEQTRDLLLAGKDCGGAPVARYQEEDGSASVSDYYCADGGRVNTFVLEQGGGHRLGSHDLSEATAARQQVFAYLITMMSRY